MSKKKPFELHDVTITKNHYHPHDYFDASLLTKTIPGVILPTDAAASATLSGPLSTFNIPAVAYSTSSADAAPDAVSVVPRVQDYVTVGFGDSVIVFVISFC